MLQRSDAWFEARRGKLTASRFADMMAKPDTVGYQSLVQDLAWERWSGKNVETYSNAAMNRGTELEPEARSWFEWESGLTVVEEGFIVHSDYPFIGVSPDGLTVEDEGLLEIKCPLHRAHMETVREQKVPTKYKWQTQGQLWVAKRNILHYVSYHPEAPRQALILVERNDKDIAALEQRALETNELIERMVAQLRGD